MRTLFLLVPLAVWAAGRACAAPTTGPAETRDPAVVAAEAFASAVQTGDTAYLTRAVAVTNADEQLLRDGLVRNLVALGRLHAAMVDRFGQAASGQFGVSPLGEAEAWQKATSRRVAAGTQVLLAVGGRTVELTMLNQDGHWKVPFAAATAYAGTRHVDLGVPSDEPLRRWNESAEALATTAAAVRAGQFADAAAAGRAAEKAFSDAVRGANAN